MIVNGDGGSKRIGISARLSKKASLLSLYVLKDEGYGSTASGPDRLEMEQQFALVVSV